MRHELRVTAPLLLAGAALAVQLGCAGGRGNVRFDTLEYPVSMSGYVYDARQRPLSPKSLNVVGEFSHSMRLWGMFFSWIPLTGNVDASQAINRSIGEHGGDGVINLSIRSEGCAINYVPALSLLPIWPGCADVTVEGQVVKRKSARRRSSAAR